MTAKEKLLERAPHWSEEQAERALLAVEGDSPARPKQPVSLLQRAAALRARQTKVVDAAALVRESRGELEQRA
ncbi:hypothetical protein [Conexibacter arvalis]|uniref:Uncharacterized protein n=1 Tax=Conexibacter arvalis TaxID=912552 RepID=A0A840IJ98_9ACTN|nr:hypothetical protein [Conexibacter arvalis]MBB4665092.1 hypothetical protein [Conexibacter arvalis]